MTTQITAQLRTLLLLTNTEAQIATARQAQARTDGVRRARAQTGGLKASELPIAEYPAKNVTDAVAAIKELSTAEDLQAMLGFEEAHKNRRSVVSATQAHLATVAKDVVGIPSGDAASTS